MEPWLEADAVMSACGRYRYALRRRWRQGSGELLVVGLNPSRADARVDDPTPVSYTHLTLPTIYSV